MPRQDLAIVALDCRCVIVGPRAGAQPVAKWLGEAYLVAGSNEAAAVDPLAVRSRQRVYATYAASTPTTKGIPAVAGASVPNVVTVAPIMMITSPAAANGVRPRRTRSSSGRISPIAPSTSHTPMNRKNTPGRVVPAVNTSIGMT